VKVESGKVDGQRLCITGRSAGGYSTLAALAFRDTFKAGASLYGVSSSFVEFYCFFLLAIHINQIVHTLIRLSKYLITGLLHLKACLLHTFLVIWLD